MTLCPQKRHRSVIPKGPPQPGQPLQVDGSPRLWGDDGRRDASTPPRGSKTARRGVLSSWIIFCVSTPYRPLGGHIDAFPAGGGGTLHRDARGIAPLNLASQREDAPAPMDQTARLRQETPRGSSPGMPTAAATKRRPWIWPRTPTKKSEHPGAQTGPPEVAAAGGGGIQSLAAQGGRPDLHLHAAFLAFLHPICRW